MEERAGAHPTSSGSRGAGYGPWPWEPPCLAGGQRTGLSGHGVSLGHASLRSLCLHFRGFGYIKGDTVVPLVCSETPSRCLKPRTVLNPTDIVFPEHTQTYIKFMASFWYPLIPVSPLLCSGPLLSKIGVACTQALGHYDGASDDTGGH